MKKLSNPTLHIIFLIGAVILALAFRLIRLGVLPLNDMEAELALQAWYAAQSTAADFGPQIAYIGLTGITNFIFQTSNFLARFWPAFSGALIVFVPFLFRDRIGHWPATIMSVVLALSPEMVSLSRIIGSPMMAFVFLLLSLGFWFNEMPVLMGVTLAVALMSGEGFWIGALILGLSYMISEIIFGFPITSELHEDQDQKAFWRDALIAGAVTLFVVGTAFFMAPAGLTAVFSGLIAFGLGFIEPFQAPLYHLPVAILAYVLGALILGLWGGIRAFQQNSPLDKFLVVWFFVGFIFLLIYPAGGVADIVWVTIPLWLLSARVVVFSWRWPKTSRIVVVLTALMIVLVAAFMALTLRSMVRPILSQAQRVNHLIALGGGLVMVFAILVLVVYGWTGVIARTGLLAGVGIVILMSLISVSVNSTGLGPHVPATLWYPNQPLVTTRWLRIQMDRIIIWNASRSEPVEILVSDYRTPAMEWFLVNDSPVSFESFIPPQTQPGMLITDRFEIPEIAHSYHGQDLTWSQRVLWENMTAFQYLNWLITRESPTVDQLVILWVRTDLMIDG